MNQQEREQLREILHDMEAIYQHAPSRSTYRQGRVEGNVAVMVLAVLKKLRRIVGDDEAIEQPTNKPTP